MNPQELRKEQAQLVQMMKAGMETQARHMLGELLVKENGMLPGSASLEAMITDILKSLMAPA